jgi:hypothetical protein
MHHRPYLVLLVVAMLVILPACHKQEQPAETNTMGNATDRNPATGTTGTGQPTPPAVDTAAAATQLGTAGTTTATAPPGQAVPAVVGTEEVHGQQTVTTSTISQPGVSSTQSVQTPSATTATIKTTTGTVTATAPKKKH